MIDTTLTPPMSIQAEQSVLGALMLDNRSAAKITDWLRSDDFYRRDHQVLYESIVTLIGQGTSVDAVTLGEALAGDAELGDALDYALQIASNTPSAANIVSYAEIVLEASRLRQVIDATTAATSAAFGKGASCSDIVAQVQAKLASLGVERAGGLQPIKPAVKQWFDTMVQKVEATEKFSGRLTPWRAVNDLTLGLKPANLIVLAGRPGMGKSVAGFGMATFDAMRGGRPAVFSLEMSAQEFVEREIAALGDVPHEWLRHPDKEAKDEHDQPAYDTFWARASRASQQLIGSNLLIDDTPNITIQQISARAKRAHLQSPLSLVLIDHLHIVKTKGGENQARELGDVSRGAKALSKELRCPVILLAQLNRSNVARTDKRPTMADLRGSGEIEQDADYILLLHREDYYDETVFDAGVVELIVGKARHAKARKIHLKNELEKMRFGDWTGPLPEAPASAAPTHNKRGMQ